LAKIKAIVFDHDGTLVDSSVLPPALFKDMKQLVETLIENGIKLYVWTARCRGSTVEILKSLDIIGHFELLSCAGESAAKPSAQGISSILFDIEPKEVVVIGDSLGDMIGGHAFGAFCIGALWGHGSIRAEQVMQDNGADICFLQVKDCLEFLKKKIEE
jgi:phosphoglycolate phosphatase-like HAD superfamily hydrolase